MRLENSIVTAADDGYIRFWDFTAIDNSESDDFGNFFIKPTSEIFLTTSEDVSNARTCTLTNSFVNSDQLVSSRSSWARSIG